MVICPSCKEQVPHSATSCPRCGENVIPADQLQDVPTKTTGWQKFVIAVSIILLIAIGFTFYGAERREDEAAQRRFIQPVTKIVSDAAIQTGMARTFGVSDFRLDAKTKEATVDVAFASGPIPQQQAAVYAQAVCAALAQSYVRHGYMPRHIKVVISSVKPGGGSLVYGQAIYNGNIDALGWEPANMAAQTAK